MTTGVFDPKTITIYSVGLLGGSIGLSLKRTGWKGTVIGVSSPTSIATALAVGAIDEGCGYDLLDTVIGRTDLLIICSPISGICDALKKLGTLTLPKNLLITDIGSTKSEITRLAATVLPEGVLFVGGHPMAGSEKSGVNHSDPYLFANAIYALTPSASVLPAVTEALGVFLDTHLGSRHVVLDPEVHDTIAATVSHVPHVLAVALVNMAEKMNVRVPGTLSLAAGGFRDMTRIASSPYGMWHDIINTNIGNINELIDAYMDELHQMKTELSIGSLQQSFDSAASVRRTIPSSSKGFVHQLSEILVVAKDKPGEIFLIAKTMADVGINIKDIEVLKVREGEGGTIRLSFDTRAIAAQAVALLTAHGFESRERD